MRANKIGLKVNTAVKDTKVVKDTNVVADCRVKWTDEYVAILCGSYPVGGSKLCIERGLPFTAKAIARKADKLGLKVNKK